MSFLDPLLGAVACGAEVTQLGAIGYGAEVRAALAQRWTFFNTFVFVTYLFFCCPYFSFMSLICPSWFIFHPILFLWLICLFVQIFFIRRAQQLYMQ
jgi:hypothetical protein